MIGLLGHARDWSNGISVEHFSPEWFPGYRFPRSTQNQAFRYRFPSVLTNPMLMVGMKTLGVHTGRHLAEDGL
jgi:hypothetical protein